MSRPIYTLSMPSQAGCIVEVECRISRGLPAFLIVGAANRAVAEAKERLRGAFAATGLPLPPKRITLNLAPGDIPKDGTSFDLAIAACVLKSMEPALQPIAKSMFFGELGLDGTVRPVRGLVGALLQARQHGFTTFYIPARQCDQASLIPEICLIPVQSLSELHQVLMRAESLPHRQTKSGQLFVPPRQASSEFDFSDVGGQDHAKRALEIAAAGGHNILLSGPPGTGKSMLAKALPSILPPLNQEEILEVTHLHSLANPDYTQLVHTRPFRSPHHSTSSRALLGGGSPPRPGEISLAHHGVLFLDELPEFNRQSLEALRQPLEDGTITITRALNSLRFPANFILVATANPCPCGFYGSSQPCRCLPYAIQKYQQRLSGPMMDRIDLFITVERVAPYNLLQNSTTAQTSSSIRKRVSQARLLQAGRWPAGKMNLNAGLSNAQLQQIAQISPEAKALLEQAADRLNLSARGYMRVLKVSRTIADLARADLIEQRHLIEALGYRQRENV